MRSRRARLFGAAGVTALVIASSLPAWGTAAHRHDHGSHQHHHSELPTVVQIRDPAGDANYLNDQGQAGVPVPPFGDQALPVSADPAADILSVWFSNDRESVSAHIQTQLPPPGVTGISYRVRTTPSVADPRGCVGFGASVAGPTFSGETRGFFFNPCDSSNPLGFPPQYGNLEVTKLPDGTGLITITVARGFHPILDSGTDLLEPFAYSRLLVGAPGADRSSVQMDNTKLGSRYVFAGPSVEPQSFRAGKRAVAHRQNARIVVSARTRAAAPRPVVFSTGYPAWEPTLGVDEDGDVFTTSSVTTTNMVLSSTDDGRTWQDISPKISDQNAHPISFDPYVYVDRDTNRLFNLDLQVPSCIELSFSDDKGASWTTRLTCGGVPDDHPTLFSGPPVSSSTVGYPNVVYVCVNQLVAAATCTKSLDGGSTFVPTGEPAFGLATNGVDIPCNGATGHGVADEDGVLYLPRIWCNEQPWLAVSRDEGASWEQIQVADNGGLGHEAAVAVDAEGNIYFSWVSHKDRMPYLAISRDGAKTFGPPMMIGQPGLIKASLPAIDVGDPGKIALVYMGSDAGEEWAGHITFSTNALGPKPVFYSTTANDKSQPLDTSCLHRCAEGGDFFDVVVAPDGTVWSAFTDNGAGIVARLVGGPRLR